MRLLALVRGLVIKILNLKLVILLEYWNIKILLKKVTLQSGRKKMLWLKTLLMIFIKKKLLEVFTKKNWKKKIKKSLESKKRNNSFNSWIYKKDIV